MELKGALKEMTVAEDGAVTLRLGNRGDDVEVTIPKDNALESLGTLLIGLGRASLHPGPMYEGRIRPRGIGAVAALSAEGNPEICLLVQMHGDSIVRFSMEPELAGKLIDKLRVALEPVAGKSQPKH